MLCHCTPQDAVFPYILPGIYPLPPNAFNWSDIRPILVVRIEVEPDEAGVMNGDQLEACTVLEVGIDEIQ